MNYTSILYSVVDQIARLTLNRPDRLNSFNAAMHEEVRHALAQVVADGARVLVLSGAGRGFCAGQDLGDRTVAPGARGADLGDSIERNYKPLVLALRNLPMPVIAAVNGVAAGAGASIALACDIVDCGPLGRFRPGLLSPWAGAGQRRHLVPAATGGQCARHRALDAR